MSVITRSNWVIVGKEGCVWCSKTIDLFQKRHIEFTYINAKDSLRDFMVCSNLLTVPQVFENGELIGGHEDIVDYFELHGVKEFG